MSATTADAVAMPPAPGPTSVIGGMPSASMVTALVTPITWAMAESLRTMVGCTRCSMPLSVLHRDAEQLDAIAELVGGLEIGGGDRGDALDIDRVRIDADAEGEARQDRKLLRGVVALDVERRIGLGVAEPLRLLQALGERQLLPLHAREDVVAGAVEDAVDARDRVAGKPLAQRLHDRDGAADRGLEIERDLVLLGERRERDAMARQQRLVGGDRPTCRP